MKKLIGAGWFLLLILGIMCPNIATVLFPSPKTIGIPFIRKVIERVEVPKNIYVPAPAEIVIVDKTWKQAGLFRIIKTNRGRENEYAITFVKDTEYSQAQVSNESGSIIINFEK